MSPASVMLLVLSAAWVSDVQAPSQTQVRRRTPMAMAVVDGGAWLYTANRDSGSITVVDTKSRRVVAEFDVGRALVDLAVAPDGRLLVVDRAASQLLVIAREGPRLSVEARIGVAADPIGVCVAEDGTFAVVSSRWSRRITVVALDRTGARPTHTVALAFNPRRLVVARGRVIVADAFGGKLAVVDPARGVVDSSRAIQAHNIGGLTLSCDGEGLLLTQQYLNAQAHTAADDIHWGFLMTNSVRSLRLDAVLSPEEDLVPGARLDHLGEPGHGAGDPAGVATLRDGRVIVALAGVDEVAIGPIERPDATRRKVGRRPLAVVNDPAESTAYVANAFDDTISVIDLALNLVVATIPLGPPRNEAAAEEKGERLFHDARLSHEGWMSCRSCHADGHASGFRADTLGDGAYGAPKRTLSLLGLADTPPYAWDGRMNTLEEQIRKSFQTTLRADHVPGDDQVATLAAYLRTLQPAPGLGQFESSDPAAVARGRRVFEKHRCDRCHLSPTYTSAKTYDVGLEDETGNSLFNPPSLRGVSQRERLLHDGRARRLEEVFTRFQHPADTELPREDLSDLITFLRSL